MPTATKINGVFHGTSLHLAQRAQENLAPGAMKSTPAAPHNGGREL